jgi:hypothetical protein
MRNGAWITTDQGVGIYRLEHFAVTERGRRPVGGLHDAIRPGETLVSESWVHLVNPDGTTLAALPADRCSGIKQATRADIPAERIEHLTDAQLSALGY